MSDLRFDKVVKFKLGNEYFAIPVEEVKEVVKMQNITRTPNSPPHVDGIIDLRGIVCTIIDPKKLLNISGSEEGQEERIIVLDLEGSNVGIKVDEVSSVNDFSNKEIDTNVGIGEYSRGVVKDDSGEKVELVILLDVKKLVGETEAVQTA
ncbi:MAG: chemotaxis protein CheW [Archaeoglobaceae archaeon]